MTIHESSVNYQNLIRDLAEMYPYHVAEVIVVELIANSLDAGATNIKVNFNPKNRILIVQDNGKGMTADQFKQYHDFAAGLKVKGAGIGFAGLGAKISFNIAERVITETQSPTFSGGSDWYLQSGNKLVWEEMRPTRLAGFGTRIEVRFTEGMNLPYSTTHDLTKLLQLHYLPLLDPKFLKIYERLGFYKGGVRFWINDQSINPMEISTAFDLEQIKIFLPEKAGKSFGYGMFGLAPTEYPLTSGVCGVLIATHGKVVKADFFDQFPGSFGTRIIGLVEVPDMLAFLTTSKTDFNRKGRHKDFERLYDPIRQEFKAWLQGLGVPSTETRGTDEAVKLERELKKLLPDVPELGEFLGFRTSKKVLVDSTAGVLDAEYREGVDVTLPDGVGTIGRNVGPLDEGSEPGIALVAETGGPRKAAPISRSARGGPKIAFVDAPERIDLAWVAGNDIAINSGHPLYVKVRAFPQARTLHCLYAIAGAVQKYLASDGATSDLMFVDRMMKAWGQK